MINPAYAGLHNNTELVLSNRGYLNSFDGSPKNISLSINAPIEKKDIGLGAGVMADEIGVTTITNLFAAYSYKIEFDHKNNRPDYELYYMNVLSFGITAGIQFYADNLLQLGIDDDPDFDHNIHAAIPTIGAGIMYNKENFFAGFSSPNLIGDLLSSSDEVDLKNTYYGYFGYHFFGNQFNEYIIKPSVFVKYQQGAPFQVDLNMAVNYKNKVEVGAGYRTTSSANFLLGFYIFDNWRLVYNYNQALGDSLLSSTHGISLSYRFGSGYNL